MRKILAQNVLITIASKLISFATTLFIVRELTKDDYGLYTYLIMIIGYISTLDLGLSSAFKVEAPRVIDDPNYPRFWAGQVVVSVFWNAIRGLALFIIFYDTVPVYLLCILYFMLIVRVVNTVFRTHLMSSHKFQQVNYLKVIAQVIEPISNLAIFFVFRNYESLLISQCFIALLTFAFGCWIKSSRPDFRNLKLADLKFQLTMMLSVGLSMFLAYAGSLVMRDIDRVMIANYFSLAELAEYSFPMRLTNMILLLAISLSEPHRQLILKLTHQKNWVEVKKIMKKLSLGMLGFSIASSAVLIVGYPYMLKYIVKNYYETVVYVPLFCITISILAITQVFDPFINARYRTKMLVYLHGVIAVINISLDTLVVLLDYEMIYILYATLFSFFIYASSIIFIVRYEWKRAVEA